MDHISTRTVVIEGKNCMCPQRSLLFHRLRAHTTFVSNAKCFSEADFAPVTNAACARRWGNIQRNIIHVSATFQLPKITSNIVRKPSHAKLIYPSLRDHQAHSDNKVLTLSSKYRKRKQIQKTKGKKEKK